MINYLSRLDNKLLDVIKKFGQLADERGIFSYVVGGIVRDLILKRKNFDLDIVVIDDAAEFARWVAPKLKAQVKVYNQFKTATLELPNKLQVDLVTARREFYPFSGALPEVEPGTLKDDLFRRDFTVNALAISINKRNYGCLVDEFGCLEDLKKGRLRVLHDMSFEDDPTRILRAVRFEQRLGFTMEEKTLALLRQALLKKRDGNVKAPRYFEEFKKVLKEDKACKMLLRLQQLNGLKFIDKNLKVNTAAFILIENNKRQLDKGIYGGVFENWWFIRFLILIEKMNKNKCILLCQKFQLPREARESIKSLANVLPLISQLSKGKLPRSYVYKLLKPLNQHLLLYLRVRTRNSILIRHVERFLRQDNLVEIKITGQDLIGLGLKSGKIIGRILQEIHYAKIDKKLTTKSEELKLASQLISR